MEKNKQPCGCRTCGEVFAAGMLTYDGSIEEADGTICYFICERCQVKRNHRRETEDKLRGAHMSGDGRLVFAGQEVWHEEHGKRQVTGLIMHGSGNGQVVATLIGGLSTPCGELFVTRRGLLLHKVELANRIIESAKIRITALNKEIAACDE